MEIMNKYLFITLLTALFINHTCAQPQEKTSTWKQIITRIKQSSIKERVAAATSCTLGTVVLVYGIIKLKNYAHHVSAFNSFKTEILTHIKSQFNDEYIPDAETFYILYPPTLQTTLSPNRVIIGSAYDSNSLHLLRRTLHSSEYNPSNPTTIDQLKKQHRVLCFFTIEPSGKQKMVWSCVIPDDFSEKEIATFASTLLSYQNN